MSRAVIIDTSALVSVIFGEPDAELIASVLVRRASDLKVSAATVVECEIVVGARAGTEARLDLLRLLEQLEIDVVAFNREHALLATAAWRRFGKGRHPAALNLGDCYSYALAKHLDGELLYKGHDFSQTDVASAL